MEKIKLSNGHHFGDNKARLLVGSSKGDGSKIVNHTIYLLIPRATYM